MASEHAAASAAVSDHGQNESKFYIFVQIAMILAVITGAEIVLVYVPIAKWVVMSVLIILSIVKFMFVIFYFMHLRWDRLLCTIVFFIGLVLACGTTAALLAIFGDDASKPLTMSDAAPVAAEYSQLG